MRTITASEKEFAKDGYRARSVMVAAAPVAAKLFARAHGDETIDPPTTPELLSSALIQWLVWNDAAKYKPRVSARSRSTSGKYGKAKAPRRVRRGAFVLFFKLTEVL